MTLFLVLLTVCYVALYITWASGTADRFLNDWQQDLFSEGMAVISVAFAIFVGVTIGVMLVKNGDMR